MFSPSKIQGMNGRYGLGGACSHIKTYGFSHSHIVGPTCLMNAGENTGISFLIYGTPLSDNAATCGPQLDALAIRPNSSKPLDHLAEGHRRHLGVFL